MKPIGYAAFFFTLLTYCSWIESRTLFKPSYESTVYYSEVAVLGRVNSGYRCTTALKCQDGYKHYGLDLQNYIFGKSSRKSVKIASTENLCIDCEYIFLFDKNKNSDELIYRMSSLQVISRDGGKVKQVLFSITNEHLDNEMYDYQPITISDGNGRSVDKILYRYVPLDAMKKYMLDIKAGKVPGADR